MPSLDPRFGLVATTETEIDFDPDALRANYREERDKRLRADGNEQYVEMAGEFAHYLEDPYVEPIEREPREAPGAHRVARAPGGIRTVEVSEEVEAAWVQTTIDLARFSLDFQESWTPGCYNNDDQPGSITGQKGPYGADPNTFIKLITDWREAGTFDGLELTPQPLSLTVLA